MKLLRKITDRLSKSALDATAPARLISPRQKVGAFYEQRALEFLLHSNYYLVARNYLCKFGELDLIMEHDNILVFIEVKYRKKSRYGLAIETITKNKIERLKRSAECFINDKRQYRKSAYRFDIISFDNDNISHLINAFGP